MNILVCCTCIKKLFKKKKKKKKNQINITHAYTFEPLSKLDTVLTSE